MIPFRLVCLRCNNNPCKCEPDERTKEINVFNQAIRLYEFPRKKVGKCITCSKRRQRGMFSAYGAACLLECDSCHDVRWIKAVNRVSESVGFEVANLN